MQCRRRAYETGLLKRSALERPLVCVGNLTLGGTGKTPMVLMVAERLGRQGRKVAIISRGYGRKIRSDDPVIVSDGKGTLASLEESGDEPMMMALQAPHIPIVVCADRHKAGQLAIERFGCDVVIMDDGYQRLSLKRDLDLLVFDGATSLDRMRLFPAGRLREPMKNMDRAGACIVSRANLCPEAPIRVQEIKKRSPAKPVFLADLVVRHIYTIGDRAHRASLEDFRDKPVLVVSALGHPEGFLALAEKELGVVVAGSVAFRDHHAYSAADVERINREKIKLGVHYVLTTEKDAIKLCAHSSASHWHVVAVNARLQNPSEEDLLDRLLTSL